MNDSQFVSRGGLKLQHAISNFKFQISNLICLDIGSSTGGFVDCLLQNGAQKVYSVDTSYGELAWKLRNDPKVVVMERTNILHLDSLPPVIARSETTKQSSQKIATGSLDPRDDASTKVDLITIDAGWTKLELVLPIVKKFLKKDGTIIALLKPHYEANKSQLQKGVLPKDLAEKTKDQVLEKIRNLNFQIKNCIESPILGGAGNAEYLLKIKPP